MSMAGNPQRGSRPVFHDLPEEIAVEIFLRTAHAGKPWLYYVILHALAQVCVRWWCWIKRTPSLWRVLSDDAAYPLTRILSKSYGTRTPLDISVDRGERSYPLYMSAAPLIAEVARWRSLEVWSRYHGTLEALAGEPLDAVGLEVLEVRSYNECRWLKGLDGRMPRLRSLFLQGCILDWNRCTFVDLRKLTLMHLGSKTPSVAQIANMLRSSRRLESFALDTGTARLNTRVDETIGSAGLPPPVTMPFLKSLAIIAAQTSMCPFMELLSLIDAPACTTFGFDGRTHEWDATPLSYQEPLLQAISGRIATSNAVILSQCGHVTITVTSSEIIVQAFTPLHMLSLRLRTPALFPLAWIGPLCGAGSSSKFDLPSATIDITTGVLLFRDVAALLEGPWRVTNLRLTDWSRGNLEVARRVVDFLTERTAEGCRLPELSKLKLEGEIPDIEDMRRMVVARSKSTNAGDGAEDNTQTSSRCVPLTKLVMVSDRAPTSPDSLAALQELLGEGVLEHRVVEGGPGGEQFFE